MFGLRKKPFDSLSATLRPQAIVLDADAKDRAAVLGIAAAHIAAANGLKPEPIARALMRREDSLSTALGHGVAIPHARIVGIAQPLTLFLRTHRPVAFAAPDGAGVSNFFVIMVPADGDNAAHLAMLASVASAFSDKHFRRELARATTAREIDAAFSARMNG
jgi:PTS system nitrogen regulatory IIA component